MTGAKTNEKSTAQGVKSSEWLWLKWICLEIIAFLFTSSKTVGNTVLARNEYLSVVDPVDYARPVDDKFFNDALIKLNIAKTQFHISPSEILMSQKYLDEIEYERVCKNKYLCDKGCQFAIRESLIFKGGRILGMTIKVDNTPLNEFGIALR